MIAALAMIGALLVVAWLAWSGQVWARKRDRAIRRAERRKRMRP